MKKYLLRLVAIVSMIVISVPSAYAVTFNDLSGYQKQKYWSYITECQPLLAAQNYTDYRTCALNAMDKAYNTAESGAWCISSTNNVPDYFKKGVVKTDLKPEGIEDYVYDYNGISYVMEGFCNDVKQYSYYVKNCLEFGPGYYADKNLGSCVAPVPQNNPPVVAPVADKYVAVGKTLSFKVTATDPEGDAIVGYDVSPALPAGATFDTITGNFVFTPGNESVDKKFVFSFTASDGKTSSAAVSVNVFVHPNATPTFVYYEKADSPTSVSAGKTITKEFILKNTDKTRYIVMNLEVANGGNTSKKYVPPSWVSFLTGTSYKIEANSSIIVKVNITVPAGTNPELYTLNTKALLSGYGGATGCSTGLCLGVAIGMNSNVNVLP